MISRVNLCSPSIPNVMKATALKLLEDSNKILQDLLQDFGEFDDEIANSLDCYYTCGLLCVLLHRFSLQTTAQDCQISNSTSELSILELNKSFFENLNEKFNLTKRINNEIKNLGGEKENFNKLFLLVHLFF